MGRGSLETVRREPQGKFNWIPPRRPGPAHTLAPAHFRHAPLLGPPLLAHCGVTQLSVPSLDSTPPATLETPTWVKVTLGQPTFQTEMLGRLRGLQELGPSRREPSGQDPGPSEGPALRLREASSASVIFPKLHTAARLLAARRLPPSAVYVPSHSRADALRCGPLSAERTS